ncbi:MAG TPA: ribbon-helix-helix domain-containing protein [Gaiellaceae bacterium]|nr:ribbon-helix-helix domain-containing protein [Gaiellaceae bacterium]
MSQLVTRIDDDLARALDALVAEGVVESRSEAVRTALRELIDRHRRRQRAEADVAAYTRMPQTDDELWGIDEATRRMIEEEPW